MAMIGSVVVGALTWFGGLPIWAIAVLAIASGCLLAITVGVVKQWNLEPAYRASQPSVLPPIITPSSPAILSGTAFQGTRAITSGDKPLFYKFPFHGQDRYACSVCSHDFYNLADITNHVVHNHGFGIEEAKTPQSLNLVIHNASSGGAILNNFRIVLYELKKRDDTVGQYHLVRQLEGFTKISLPPGEQRIYMNDPTPFQMVDCADASRLIVHATPESGALDWAVPSSGKWRMSLAAEWIGGKSVKFHRYFTWDGNNPPEFSPHWME